MAATLSGMTSGKVGDLAARFLGSYDPAHLPVGPLLAGTETVSNQPEVAQVLATLSLSMAVRDLTEMVLRTSAR